MRGLFIAAMALVAGIGLGQSASAESATAVRPAVSIAERYMPYQTPPIEVQSPPRLDCVPPGAPPTGSLGALPNANSTCE